MDKTCILTGFIHADDTDGTIAAVQRFQISLCAWIQTAVEKPPDHLPACFQDPGRKSGSFLQFPEKALFIPAAPGNSGEIQSHSPKTAPAPFPGEKAFHRRTVSCKDRISISGSSLKDFAFLWTGPVDADHWNWKGEPPAFCISIRKNAEERLPDHLHFRLTVPIPDSTVRVRLCIFPLPGHTKIEYHIGECRLCPPTAGGVQAIDQGFHCTLDLFRPQAVFFHERSKAGIKMTDRLGSGPFILHDGNEIHQLGTKCVEMSRGSGRYLSPDMEPLLNQTPNVPACTAGCQHFQIMDMEPSIVVRPG